MPKGKTILIINGSLAGRSGNTAKILEKLKKKLPKEFKIDQVCLKDKNGYEACRKKIKKSDGIVLGTGTHWSSWSSVFQGFLEYMTKYPDCDEWGLGKPCAVIVTMHSVGGDGVMSKTVNMMNMVGAYVPPFCAMTYSLVNQIALKHMKSNLYDELWSLDDLDTVCNNLSEAVKGTNKWKSWNFTKNKPNKIYDVWLK